MFPPVDREATREKMRPSASARLVEEGQGVAGGSWTGARMTMTGLINEASKSTEIPNMKPSTVTSQAPLSQISLI